MEYLDKQEEDKNKLIKIEKKSPEEIVDELDAFLFGLEPQCYCCLCNKEIYVNLSLETLQLKHLKECENNKQVHYVHINCLTSAVENKIACQTEAFCKKCNLLISDQETVVNELQRQKDWVEQVKMINLVNNSRQFSKKIGDFVREHYKEEILKTFNYYVCKKCNHTTSVSSGEVDYNIKNLYGQQISPNAAIHYSLNKIQCEKCNYVSCNECKIEPYHIGYTCQDYRTYLDTRVCRFCRNVIGLNKQQLYQNNLAFEEACNSDLCNKLLQASCDKIHKDCGHPCCGTKKEVTCLPCLNQTCVNLNQDLTFGVNQQECCSICYTDELGQAPTIQLNCKHMFHKDCLKTILKQKYQTLRISFGYLDCPICSIQMETTQCPEIQALLTQQKQFKENVYSRAHTTAQREGVYNEEEYKERKEFRDNPREYAMLKLAIYECYKCQRIYCGGRRNCEAEMNEANQPKKEDILCVYCTAVKSGNKFAPCKTHGEDYMGHKCQFCCETASWFCWGATRFCDPCHNVAAQNLPKICNPETCQLKGNHPPNGTPFSFGCKLCKIFQEEEENKILERKKELIGKLLRIKFAKQESQKRERDLFIWNEMKRINITDEQQSNLRDFRNLKELNLDNVFQE
eukprot:403371993